MNSSYETNNPYQTPSEFHGVHRENASVGENPIRFGGEVDPKEVKSLFSSWLTLVGLLLLGGYYFFNDLRQFIGMFNRFDFLGLVAVSIVVFAIARTVFMVLRYRLGNGYLDYFRKNYPDLFLPLQGELNNQFLVVLNQNMRSQHLRSAITNVFITQSTIWLLFDSMGMNSRFLPKSLFADPWEYQRMIEAVAEDVKRNRRSQIHVWNNSDQCDPGKILPRNFSDSGISMSGLVTKRDCMTPELKKRIWQSTKKVVLHILYILLVGLAVSYLLVKTMALMLLVIGAITFMLVFGQFKKLKQLGIGVPNDRVLVAYQGKVCEDQFEMATPLAIVDCRWTAFEAAQVVGDTLALRFNGQAYVYFFLLRSHFASDQDWEACCQLVQRKINTTEY